jgi:hypothetical protein
MALPTVTDAQGITRLTLKTTVSVNVGDLIGFDGTDWVKADADAGIAAEFMAMQSVGLGEIVTVCRSGVLTDTDAPYTAGSDYYLSTTAGAHGTTVSEQRIGQALSTSELAVNLWAVRNGVMSLTSATFTVPKTAQDMTYVLNRAAGVTVTLPDATASGRKLRFIVGTTVTSNNDIIAVPDAANVMTGHALLAQDAADTAVMFETASDSDTITMNGSTKGGIKGDIVELIDIGADLWWVRVQGSATGTEATPFSAAVS